MERVRESWYAREEVQKITSDWVKSNCKLTEREKELIQIVYERKLVRRDHLEVISQSYRNLGLNRTRIMNRAIKKMFKMMIFDKVHEKQEIGKGSNPCLVALDRAGSVMLGVNHKRRIIHKRTTFKGQYYVSRNLPVNYRHINGVNGIEVDTILFCDEMNYEIIQWKHEIVTKFYFNEETIHFIPDVFCELQLNGKPLLLFIEYDTGSENFRYKTNFPTIHEKVVNYRKYYKSDLWKEHYPIFPLVLFVTESSDKRVEYFNEKCKENGLKGFGVFHLNYVEFLMKLVEIVNKKPLNDKFI